MNQYPKWLLALNFPNILLAFVSMTLLMFGGIHPFGHIDSTFWSFMIYLLSQLLWLLPILTFFISLLSWGYTRYNIAIGTAIFGWVINLTTLYLLIIA